MKPAYLPSLKTLIQSYRRPLMGALGTLMLGTGVVAFGISPALPDAAQLPVRQVVEPVAASVAVPEFTGSSPEFLVHQSQTTRRDDSVQTLLRRLGIDDRDARCFSPAMPHLACC